MESEERIAALVRAKFLGVGDTCYGCQYLASNNNLNWTCLQGNNPELDKLPTSCAVHFWRYDLNKDGTCGYEPLDYHLCGKFDKLPKGINHITVNGRGEDQPIRHAETREFSQDMIYLLKGRERGY